MSRRRVSPQIIWRKKVIRGEEIIPFLTLVGFVTNKSSPTICNNLSSFIPNFDVNDVNAPQSS